MIDEILKKVGMKYEDLNSAERETLQNWINTLNQKAITLGSVKDYISAMRDSVENELAKTGHENRQDIYLKARLRNYLLLLGFLTGPEKAKQALDRALSGMVKNKL